MAKHQHNKRRNYTMHYLFIITHRWMGFLIALFILMLATTGIMLNHTEQLSLSKKNLDNPFILSWYGIKMPDRKIYYQIDNTNIVQLGDRIYFNEKLLAKDPSQLKGVLMSNDMILVSTATNLYLLTASGELIEKLNSTNGLPTPIEKIANNEQNQAYLQVNNKWYTSFDDYLSWVIPSVKASSKAVAEQYIPSSQILKTYQNLYIGNSFPLERFILDLHSGRIITEHGVDLMDLVAILMILLTLSGSYIWVKRTFR